MTVTLNNASAVSLEKRRRVRIQGGRRSPGFQSGSRSGVTLAEVMVSLAISSMVLLVVATLVVFGARSFIALGNYSVLDQQSRLAADQMTREIRQATAVVEWETNGSPRWIIFTNALKGITITYSWNPELRELASRRSDEDEGRVILGSCDWWSFELWDRVPQPDEPDAFHAAASPNLCKLVNMTWKCSRPLAGTNLMNTEIVQTARIVLRNQRSN